MEYNFVKLKHRQIWSDTFSCGDIQKDGIPLSSFKNGFIPIKRILLTVRNAYFKILETHREINYMILSILNIFVDIFY